MQVSTKLFFDRTSDQLTKLSSQAQDIQRQVASNQRLSTPSDDPAAYRRIELLKRANVNDVAWGKNVDLAKTLLNQSDTTLDSVTSLLQRGQELVLQGNNGTLGDSDRKIVAQQLRGVVDDLVNLANTRDARGQPLFGAANGDVAVSRDASGQISFAGTGSPPAIPIGEGLSVNPSESAERLFGNLPASGGGTTDIFKVLQDFASALDSGQQVAGAPAAINGLQATLDQVNAVRGSIGARAARLDLETQRLSDTKVSRDDTLGQLEGVDLQSAIIELQKTSTILSATQASLTKLSQLSIFDYLR